MAFDAIEFKNYKILRDAVLPLQRFTVIVGPNSSGKSTALDGIRLVQNMANLGRPFKEVLSLGAADDAEITVRFQWATRGPSLSLTWNQAGQFKMSTERAVPEAKQAMFEEVKRIRVFRFRPQAISQASALRDNLELDEAGTGLASVLDRMRDVAPERFEQLDAAVCDWFPEFDRILFNVRGNAKSFSLRRANSKQAVPAIDLSHGTLLAMAIMTIAFLPELPPIIGIEEPEIGVHPRLLRDVQQALYRLSNPGEFGDDRQPVQVVATTHSPYFLDFFKDNPSEVVIASRDAQNEASFTRLVDLPNITEILGGAPLGDAWFTGLLGGVPVNR